MISMAQRPSIAALMAPLRPARGRQVFCKMASTMDARERAAGNGGRRRQRSRRSFGSSSFCKNHFLESGINGAPTIEMAAFIAACVKESDKLSWRRSQQPHRLRMYCDDQHRTRPRYRLACAVKRKEFCAFHVNLNEVRSQADADCV